MADCSTKVARPTGRVNMPMSVCRMNAKAKSFQDRAKEKIAAEIIPGRALGRQTSHRARARDAPEVQAASSSERGTTWKYCHMIQMLSGREIETCARIRPV